MNKIQYLNSLAEAFDKEVVDTALDLSRHYSPKEIVPRLKAKFGKSPAESTISGWVKKRPVPKRKDVVEPSPQLSFPRDLRKLTPEQTERVIDDWSKETLAQLRRRQRIANSQYASGVEQLKRAYDPAIRNRLEDGLENIEIVSRQLIAAIDRKEFVPHVEETTKELFKLEKEVRAWKSQNSDHIKERVASLTAKYKRADLKVIADSFTELKVNGSRADLRRAIEDKLINIHKHRSLYAQPLIGGDEKQTKVKSIVDLYKARDEAGLAKALENDSSKETWTAVAKELGYSYKGSAKKMVDFLASNVRESRKQKIRH